MKTSHIMLALAAGAFAVALPATSQARSSYGFSISTGGPAYYAPPPVYYAPPPVYYAPPPVYYRPVYPAPYYRPAPAFSFSYYGR